MLTVNLDLIATGIILISAWSSGSSFDNFSNHQLENAWSRGLETLHRMVDVHPSARDYAIALSGLKQTYLPTSLQSKTSLFSRINILFSL